MESREEKESQGKILWKIFLSTLYLSAFTFGGGYVIVTLMKKKFVDEYHWIGEDEMLDLVAIAQSSPGAIAVNGAIVVGYSRMADHVGIHGSDHDITDNTGPHCSEFRHLRGTEDCRDSRSCGGNGRVYFAVLHYCDDPGKTIPEVS